MYFCCRSADDKAAHLQPSWVVLVVQQVSYARALIGLLCEWATLSQSSQSESVSPRQQRRAKVELEKWSLWPQRRMSSFATESATRRSANCFRQCYGNCKAITLVSSCFQGIKPYPSCIYAMPLILQELGISLPMRFTHFRTQVRETAQFAWPNSLVSLSHFIQRSRLDCLPSFPFVGYQSLKATCKHTATACEIVTTVDARNLYEVRLWCTSALLRCCISWEFEPALSHSGPQMRCGYKICQAGGRWGNSSVRFRKS